MRTLLLLLILAVAPAMVQAQPCVVLLHGLARSADSMLTMQTAIEDAGYDVVNIDYPSREKSVDELIDVSVAAGLQQCNEHDAETVSFVTHSLGGILVRRYFQLHSDAKPFRVVMLGPPNQGSEVVDHFRDVPGFELLNGPAGNQLGTDPAGIAAQLGPVDFELGVIAGTQSINLILSAFLPDPDDGKVSVENTRVEGMCGFITLPVTHPLMMKNDDVIAQTLAFLDSGKFSAPEAAHYACPAQQQNAAQLSLPESAQPNPAT